MSENFKTCTGCDETKPATREFWSPTKGGLYGLQSRCKSCMCVAARAYNAAHRSQSSHYRKLWHRRQVAEDPAYVIKHRERTRIAQRKMRADPARRAALLAALRQKRTDSPEFTRRIGRIEQSRRRAARLKAMPVWANRQEIDALYAQAQALTESTGTDWHVDHIIPLRGKNVCGLHVETNLRVISAHENHRKANLFSEEHVALTL